MPTIPEKIVELVEMLLTIRKLVMYDEKKFDDDEEFNNLLRVIGLDLVTLSNFSEKLLDEN